MEKHIHHIQPKYLIGIDNSPDNLTPLISIFLHAALHKDLYEHFGNTEDFIAWKKLSGLSLKDCIFTPEVRKKIGDAHRGKIISEETKRKISKTLKGRKRTTFSKETKRKMSESAKGKHLGPRSEEIKRKISIFLKGKDNHQLGRKRSLETKQKMRKPHKRKNEILL